VQGLDARIVRRRLPAVEVGHVVVGGKRRVGKGAAEEHGAAEDEEVHAPLSPA
jgi:hypothetical protein